QKGWVEYIARSTEINMQYILPQERSFTIIAFPTPEIGEHFREIFEDTIKVNTLDYMKYRAIQQCLIDALDQADHVRIRGMKGNATDLTVNLWKLKDPKKETIFENCVADVNIPVGEVFTSPVLEGTNGVLHVSRVFLNGLEYKDLSLTFRDGMIADYSCGNFPQAEEGKRYIKENVLFHRETLPIGEFAIGTNTTAYVMARKWGIEKKLPILIAEKTGPHFAVGDTCYSHAEDVVVYNPDGKEIVARENEKSMLRGTDPAAAYFNCHTDITIPYDELGELTAVHSDGTCVPIILEGRFVLEGSEMLNEPLEQA
ncbi:MAG: aminopeptidase, partial [Acetatifactor sp.]|nr:aminopeptidase [Acetatifactor sp.]